jgi:hypothetical protein
MAQRYFDLSQDVYVPGCWILKSPVDVQGQELRSVFNQGKPVRVDGPLHIPLCQPGNPIDYSEAATESVPIVSARVAALFAERAPQDIQLIPAKVDGRQEPYFIVNILRVVRCIDEKKSSEVRHREPKEGMPAREGYELVSGMRIDPALVGDAHLFRTWGWESVIVVSESLKEALEKLGATGLRFEEVTGPSPISDAARARRDKSRQLLEESDAFRDAVWHSLGTLAETGSNLIIAGGPGPAGYQHWRIIHRPEGRCLLVSHYLSAPFIDTLEPSVGHGLELLLETDVDVSQARDPWKTWPVRLLRRVSHNLAENAELRTLAKADLFILDLPGRGLPRFLHTPKGDVTVLLGIPSRSLPASFSTPYGEVKLLTVKPLLPEEVAWLDSHGESAADELVRRFVEHGQEHLSPRRRPPVI